MKSVFAIENFEFPYLYKFPGQASDEKILFLTRENKIMLSLRIFGVIMAAFFVLISGWFGGVLVGNMLGIGVGSILQFISIILAAAFFSLGSWWVYILWKKSICIVTSKRLTKYIYTTPFNRHNLSLPLDQIVDTGAYSKGFVQALFKLGTFTARSSAASSGVATDDDGGKRVNKKYFYIENIGIAEDLQHYVNKLLNANRHHLDKITSFRPFIPGLKGEKRANYMKKYPEYWS